jgi:hypothetical protein
MPLKRKRMNTAFPPPTEDLAFKLLTALQKEFDIEPSLIKCRPMAAIASSVLKSQEEFSRVERFIMDNHLIDAVNRPDGRAAKPNRMGLAFLESHKPKPVWNLDNRLKIFALVVAILGVLWAVISWTYSNLLMPHK